MKVFSLATLTLKRNKKQYMIYWTHTYFCNCHSFDLFRIYQQSLFNRRRQGQRNRWSSWSGYTIINGITILIILFCWFMIIYASQYNFNKKHQEFGILFTCGFNLLDFIKYTLIQMGIVFIFCFTDFIYFRCSQLIFHSFKDISLSTNQLFNLYHYAKYLFYNDFSFMCISCYCDHLFNRATS